MTNSGYWGGYIAHRYRDKAVAKKKPQPILKDNERKQAIGSLMDILVDWRVSRFERESATVTGLRSSFCLAGYDWDRSDLEARTLVSTVYTILGYARPRWEEGQPEYTTPIENCLWCSRPVPDELRTRSHTGRYCSSVCARKAILHRELRTVGGTEIAYRAAADIVRRMRHALLSCVQCGKMFRPQKGRATDRYCSLHCSSLSQITVPERECLCCGKNFRPFNNLQPGKFCSVECVNQSFKDQQIQTTCECCGSAFVAKNKISKYCSSRCSKIVQRFRAGNLPKHLSPKVFDYVFKQAA